MPGVLAHLSSLTAGPGTLFSHPAPHVLFVDSLYHRVDPVSARGWGSPLAKPSAERGRQVASGRMDVFLPYSAPRPEFPPYVEDDEYPQDCGLQNIEDMLPEEDEVSSSSDSELEEQPPGRWDMPDPQSAEGPRPSHPRPERGGAPTSTSSWMEEAAGREQRMLADRMLADRFYSAPARRRTPSKPSSFAAPKPRPPPPKPPAAAAAADPRTLFRPPPPWSSLPAQPPPRRQAAAPAGRMPTGVFASPSAAHTPRPQGAPAAQTRKRMVTLSSVQHMLDMVQKRSSGPDKAGRARAAPPSVPLGRANPFARSAQATAAGAPRLPLPKAAAPSALAPALDGQRPAGRARSPEPEGHPRPRASPRPRPPANARTDHARPGPSSKSVGKRPAPPPSPAPSRASCGTSRPDPSPSRPAKRLKPITTLTVPDWPGARMKPLSEHNRKLQPPTPSAGTAPKAQRQTTLSATTGARGSGGERTLDDVAGAKAQAQRRVPAPRPAPRRLEVAALKLERGQSIAAKPKGGGTEKGGRKPSGGGTGKAFDWKGWSAG
ncbi:hypothetical protein BD310DRAFT_30554 [Dichomitus squalens]|uniref:Uncharacterized protein n=1 Tax=Dichomitus squalens TaxID=114155 RepID=A0A4Q9QF87_9APHY|nr:hypothetical protein BD310DRAFT_30554 [Dichomitus squalens]